MPGRMIRRTRGAAPKYKWCGHAANYVPLTKVSTATTDVQLLCPSLTVSESQGEVVVERILLNFSVRRLLTSTVNALGFMVANQKVVPTTGVPLEVLNPLETTTDAFTFGNKDLLLQGLIPAPGLLLKADDSFEVSKEVIHAAWEFNGRRRLARLNHALTLTIVTDVSSVLTVFTTCRALVRFS